MSPFGLSFKQDNGVMEGKTHNNFYSQNLMLSIILTNYPSIQIFIILSEEVYLYWKFAIILVMLKNPWSSNKKYAARSGQLAQLGSTFFSWENGQYLLKPNPPIPDTNPPGGDGESQDPVLPDYWFDCPWRGTKH
jgi:hypothetical protein